MSSKVDKKNFNYQEIGNKVILHEQSPEKDGNFGSFRGCRK